MQNNYKKIYYAENVSIQIELEDGSIRCFNENTENPDYQKFLEWLDEGNQPEEIHPE
jgi:hypothetical protein